MEQIAVSRFCVAGIAVRTTNENGQSAKDIPLLWEKFFSENIAATIPDRESDAVYCVYTDYESDFTKPYTTFLGCRVADLNHVPGHLAVAFIGDGPYTLKTASGELSEGAVLEAWTGIWNGDLPRAYTSDFEVYSEDVLRQGNGTVHIFVAVQ